MATSAGVPSRLATMANRSFSSTIASMSSMTCPSMTQNWRGSFRIRSYSPSVNANNGIALLVSALADDVHERTAGSGFVGRLDQLVDLPDDGLVLGNAFFPKAHGAAPNFSDVNRAIPGVGPSNRLLLGKGSPRLNPSRVHLEPRALGGEGRSRAVLVGILREVAS